MKNMVHQVDIMRPTKALGPRGQQQGQDSVVMPKVPCSIDDLGGREYEMARKEFADATLVVEMYGDPNVPVYSGDYLKFGARTLNIGRVKDKDQNGLKLTMYCSEAR